MALPSTVVPLSSATHNDVTTLSWTPRHVHRNANVDPFFLFFLFYFYLMEGNPVFRSNHAVLLSEGAAELAALLHRA